MLELEWNILCYRNSVWGHVTLLVIRISLTSKLLEEMAVELIDLDREVCLGNIT